MQRLMLLLLLSGLTVVGGAARTAEKTGTLVIVGGGSTPPDAVKEVIKAAGGSDAPIVILAQTQTDAAKGGASSAEMYRELGAKNVEAPANVLPETIVALLAKARGVWIPGGDQNRFTQTFPESSGVPAAIREVYRRGGVVGGTSAGASLMGGKMPTGAETAAKGLSVGACPVADGLGLLPNVLVDQHFLARNRVLRLLAAVLEFPKMTGIGIDERAWIVVRDGKMEARDGQVMVARVGRSSRQSVSKTETPSPLLGSNRVSLQILLPGDRTRL
jgi:cyanophycinase